MKKEITDAGQSKEIKGHASTVANIVGHVRSSVCPYAYVASSPGIVFSQCVVLLHLFDCALSWGINLMLGSRTLYRRHFSWRYGLFLNVVLGSRRFTQQPHCHIWPMCYDVLQVMGRRKWNWEGEMVWFGNMTIFQRCFPTRMVFSRLAMSSHLQGWSLLALGGPVNTPIHFAVMSSCNVVNNAL